MKSFVPKPDATDGGGASGTGAAPPAEAGQTEETPANNAATKPRVEKAAETSEAKAKSDQQTIEADTMPTPSDATEKSRNAEVDFHGQKRSNATHISTTDPDARLYRKGKGKESKLC
jgi:hypothetical protein